MDIETELNLDEVHSNTDANGVNPTKPKIDIDVMLKLGVIPPSGDEFDDRVSSARTPTIEFNWEESDKKHGDEGSIVIVYQNSESIQNRSA